jgi:DNA-binding transcriptional LysR family regulator
MLNIHHLELFYFVARHGGISEAVRNMPYGIQQPAVSAQILNLEDHLGVTLFHRRPFALTPPGERVYQFIRPFFDGLDTLEGGLRGDSLHLRMGGSGVLLRDHLPEILVNLRKQYPKLKLTMREGHRPQLETWLKQQELDVAVTLIEGRAPAGFNSVRLLELPLVLLVEKGSKITKADEVWKRDPIDEALISLPPMETIPRQFQQELGRRNLEWLPRIEVSSLGLIETYVAHGHGIGLYVDIPRYEYSPKLRVLRLDDFPPVVLGAIWVGKSSPVIQVLLDEVAQRIKVFTA